MKPSIIIRKAESSDLEILTNLHLSSFSAEEHFPLLIGSRYLRATYQWLLSYDKSFILVATTEGKEIIGLQSVCYGPYEFRMFVACLPTLIVSILLKPKLLINFNLWSRFFRVFNNHSNSNNKDNKYDSILKKKEYSQFIIGFIVAEYRGMGAFSKLVEAAEKKCFETGSLLLITGIYKMNLSTQNIFSKLGWRIYPNLETRDTVIYIKNNE